MDAELAWFRDLGAADRSWVGVIVQAGVHSFTDWLQHELGEGRDLTGTPAGGRAAARARTPKAPEGAGLAVSVFGAAPRALAGVITLQQTVGLVRLAIEVVENSIEGLLEPVDVPVVRDAVARYAREVAFATAEVYARAAEVRGAWDARLEALVVDAVLRAETDDSVLSRASALGWAARGAVAVVIGSVPARRTETDLFDHVRRVARTAGLDALCAVQGERLVVLLGGVTDATQAAHAVVDLYGDGPVVVGPAAADLSSAHLSARAALSAHRAAPGWPQAPRPVASTDLLPERALAGDGHARRHLIEEVHVPLLQARDTMLETLAAYFATGGSIEATARQLFVHPNTVRYRLRQVTDLTGFSPSSARDAFTLQIALVLGRQTTRDLT